MNRFATLWDGRGRPAPPPGMAVPVATDEWEIKSIVDRRGSGQYTQYKVRWVDRLGGSPDTWHFAYNLPHAKELIKAYNDTPRPGWREIEPDVLEVIYTDSDDDAKKPHRKFKRSTGGFRTPLSHKKHQKLKKRSVWTPAKQPIVAPSGGQSLVHTPSSAFSKPQRLPDD